MTFTQFKSQNYPKNIVVAGLTAIVGLGAAYGYSKLIAKSDFKFNTKTIAVLSVAAILTFIATDKLFTPSKFKSDVDSIF